MSKNEREGMIYLRLPDGMRDRLKVAAAINRRSMNAEVVIRLERDFARENESPAGSAIPPGPDHSINPGRKETDDERE